MLSPVSLIIVYSFSGPLTGPQRCGPLLGCFLMYRNPLCVACIVVDLCLPELGTATGTCLAPVVLLMCSPSSSGVKSRL